MNSTPPTDLDLGDMKFWTLVAFSEQVFEEGLGEFGHDRVVAGPGYGLDGRQHRVVQLFHRSCLLQQLHLEKSDRYIGNTLMYRFISGFSG